MFLVLLVPEGSTTEIRFKERTAKIQFSCLESLHYLYSLIKKGGIPLLMGVRLEHHWRGKNLPHILHKYIRAFKVSEVSIPSVLSPVLTTECWQPAWPNHRDTRAYVRCSDAERKMEYEKEKLV